ncbi:MAG: lipoprotein-releasing system ATP-binding protein LolD [Spirochaetae bacterium HGW-Spirochaetae-8]|nr:MAG: lipoprotein-releasing system ATP-binding protein LolD [Spirochaetae bacterium HGW-Spirochaetae-8]
MEIAKLEQVTKNYRLGKTTIEALKGVSFSVQPGDFLAIVGPSGCGKTTLLNIIGCIDRPPSGSLVFDGKDVTSLTDNQEADNRLEKIGFIFQSFNLVPVLSLYENIELPLILAKVPRSERKKRVQRLIELVDLGQYLRHKPDELSGGQRQRVAIARALVNNPSLVIADEPTANLDSVSGDRILDALREMNKKEGVTCIFSTHNPDILRYASRIIHLKDGLITHEEKGVADVVS